MRSEIGAVSVDYSMMVEVPSAVIMADDAAISTGLGVTSLSVSIPSVAAVKAILRDLSLSMIYNLAQRTLQWRNA